MRAARRELVPQSRPINVANLVLHEPTSVGADARPLWWSTEAAKRHGNDAVTELVQVRAADEQRMTG
jgi:hypothetical protein